MQTKVAIIALVLISIFLGVALIHVSRKAEDQKTSDTKTIVSLSNDVTQTSAALEEQRQVNITIKTNLDSEQLKVEKLTVTLKQAEADLQRAKTESADKEVQAAQAAQAAEAAAKALKEQIAERTAKIQELEGERERLNGRLGDLTNAIAQLDSKIADTEKRLASSENDRTFLLTELKRLQAERTELERQFNDLAVLREQVKKLKDEQTVALDVLGRGVFDRKGGEVLQWGTPKKVVRKGTPDLNVEMSSKGGAARILQSTNKPAAK